MKRLLLTLPEPAANLALDEALLEAAEAGELADEVLRLWEPAAPMVIVGRSGKLAEEVHLDPCAAAGVPVLRRASGGGAIVAGPGCLMYAVVLSVERRPELAQVDAAHRTVLERLVSALRPLAPQVAWEGTSDLALDGRKFSGNSLRCKRRHVLYHGTLLYDFDLALVPRLLRAPPREPKYRDGRPHADFIANLRLGRADLEKALVLAWGAEQPLTEWPRDAVERLCAERYRRDEWNQQR
ncbi:MAG: lipoate--protein ligase family protein [Pirellulales bacterium]